jgi:DNA-binding transcriptional LysR family regulator
MDEVARMACERQALSSWPLPMKLPAFEIRMVWHDATSQDPAQGWLREQVLALCSAQRTGR